MNEVEGHYFQFIIFSFSVHGSGGCSVVYSIKVQILSKN